MQQARLKELLLQSLEHERGGIKVYETALQCVQNDDLRKEFEEYLEQTQKHEQVLLGVCQQLGMDPEEGSPGREIVKQLGAALVKAMQDAQRAGKPDAAELVACECVVLAETKDHADWQLITQCAEHGGAKYASALREAADEVEEEEDEHLYHSKGWARELWLKSLGLKAVLPPPEEQRHVTSAIGAERAKQASEKQREKH
jgi:rubrerythrin